MKPGWWRDWPRWRTAAAVVLVAASLGAVFAAYLAPALVVDLASRVWSCV